jgi:hypothetical protein
MQVVNVNSGNSEAAFQAMTFGVPSRETFDYFDQMSVSFNNNLSVTARNHFAEVEQLYKVITIDDAMNALRNLQNGYEALSLPNRIIPLKNLEELQHAPDVMLPWLMANPTARTLFDNNQIEGYGDRFLDIHGDLLGDTTVLYQAAVHGIRREVEGEYCMELFAEISSDPTMQIDMGEQLSVLDSWNELEHHLKQGDRDPTSPFNGKM